MIQTGGFSLSALPEAPRVTPFYNPVSPLAALGDGFLEGFDAASRRERERENLRLRQQESAERSQYNALRQRSLELGLAEQERQANERELRIADNLNTIARFGQQGNAPALSAARGLASVMESSGEVLSDLAGAGIAPRAAPGIARTLSGMVETGAEEAWGENEAEIARRRELASRLPESEAQRIAAQINLRELGLAPEERRTGEFEDTVRFASGLWGIPEVQARTLLRDDPSARQEAIRQRATWVAAGAGRPDRIIQADERELRIADGLPWDSPEWTPRNKDEVNSFSKEIASRRKKAESAIDKLDDTGSITPSERRHIEEYNALATVSNRLNEAGHGTPLVPDFTQRMRQTDIIQAEQERQHREPLLENLTQAFDAIDKDESSWNPFRGGISYTFSSSDTVNQRNLTDAIVDYLREVPFNESPDYIKKRIESAIPAIRSSTDNAVKRQLPFIQGKIAEGQLRSGDVSQSYSTAADAFIGR